MQGSANEPLLFESQRPYAQEDERRLTGPPQSSSAASNLTGCQFNQQQNNTNQARVRRTRGIPKCSSNNLLKNRANRRSEAIARAGHLIENFGRFISTRNNHHTSDHVISGRYSRHIEPNNSQRRHHRDDDDNSIHGVNYLQAKEPSSSENYSFRCCGGRGGRDRKTKTRHLLSALFNDKQKNKSSLLISLLRAPIVLAALFSLILVATLIVLYALSFQQHHLDHLSKQQLRQHHQLHHQLHHRLQLVSSNAADTNQQIHHINGRDLDDLDDLFLLESELHKTSDFIEIDDDDDDAGSYKVSHENLQDGLARALTVQTECGSYLGAPDGAGIVFKGIPFASPPIGERRWKRPQPVWLNKQLCNASRIVEARQWRDHCAQVSPMTRYFSGHEDCLYLDIYTPRLDQDKRLPVMVYIHGGFLAFGSSGQGGVNWLKGRPSAQLASELQVVMVAFNYRLQALGFMTMVQFVNRARVGGKLADENNNNNAPDGSGEGNYGLWDQLVALNWIKRNIESFGGDPSNIVLFGPDSASSIPLALLAISSEEDETYQEADIGGNQEHIDVKGQHLQQTNVTTSLNRPPVSQVGSSGKAETNSPNQAQFATTIDRDLFRAAWLTNPAIYHELPYELASLHYQRLFLEQSPCRPGELSKLRGSPTDSNKPASLLANNSLGEKTGLASVEPNSTQFGSRKLDDKAQLNGSLKREAHSEISSMYENITGQQIVQCLMNLSAEQVVRHYLGKDDPSYRLDDQNSLPIHGIFADQFVTVDRELVSRASYPFKGSSSELATSERQEGASKKKENATMSAKTAKPAVLFNHNQPSEISDEAHYKRSSGNSKLPSKPAAPSAASSETNYDDNCGGLICDQHNYRRTARQQQPIGTGGKRLAAGKDLLIGSSAQAVEFWQCPRDLDQWNWIDFKRYVATSLNSFLSETFTKACQLYKLHLGNEEEQITPPTATNASNDTAARGGYLNPMSPKETYLTMVSDIRQICPINELVASLRSERHRVHRYIVETRPSVQISSRLVKPLNYPAQHDRTAATTEETRFSRELEGEQRLEYAYHTWDLFAFFGFHFDPEFKASKEDLKFQAQIRKMVANFVHRREQSNSLRFDNNEEDTKVGGDNKQGVGGYTLFEKDGSISRQTNDAHREEECAMWKRQLDTSYAWIS